MQRHEVVLPNNKHAYLWEPSNPANKGIVVSLHGVGSDQVGNGTTDLPKLLNNAMGKFLNTGGEIPMFCLLPQDVNGWWTDTERKVFKDWIISKGTMFDQNKRYLKGLSGGGDGVLRELNCLEDFFAAFVVCSINANDYTATAPNMLGRPVRYFHGDRDSSPNAVTSSEAFVDAYYAAHGNCIRSVFRDLGHNTWDTVYRSNFNQPRIIKGNDPAFVDWTIDIYTWMLQFSLNAAPPEPESVPVESIVLHGNDIVATFGERKFKINATEL